MEMLYVAIGIALVIIVVVLLLWRTEVQKKTEYYGKYINEDRSLGDMAIVIEKQNEYNKTDESKDKYTLYYGPEFVIVNEPTLLTNKSITIQHPKIPSPIILTDYANGSLSVIMMEKTYAFIKS